MYANLRMTGRLIQIFTKWLLLINSVNHPSIKVKQNFLLSHRWKIDFLKKVLLSDGKKTWSFLVEDEELMSSATIEKVIIPRLKNKSEPAHKLTFAPKSLTTRLVIQMNDEHEPEAVGQKIALHVKNSGILN